MQYVGKLHLVAIGGLDPSGGAGIVRDALAARALGCEFRLVGTAWAEQSAGHGVQAINARPRGEVSRAIELALQGAPPGRTGVKIGMVVNAAMVTSVAAALADFAGPVVFDPVLGASAGGALFDPSGMGLWEALRPLAARCSVLTPNAHEAAELCGLPVTNSAEAERAATLMVERGAQAVVVKGGHVGGDTAADVLLHGGRFTTLTTPRLPGPSVRGTGCAHSASLALFLAGGASMEDACAAAQTHVANALRGAVATNGQWHLGHTS